MIVRFFEKFDDHCIIYFALIGAVLGIWRGRTGEDIMVLAIYAATIGGLCWYTAKAVLITAGTVKRSIETGEPLIKAGGLTEYDTEFARQVGEAAEAARRRNEKQ